jgi:hypothetical protein
MLPARVYGNTRHLLPLNGTGTPIEAPLWYASNASTGICSPARPLCLLTAGVLVTVTRGHFLVALAPLGAALLIGTVSLLLQREARRMVEQDHVLLTISEGLVTRLDLGDLLDHIVSTILQSVPLADKCVIHLLDERGSPPLSPLLISARLAAHPGDAGKSRHRGGRHSASGAPWW